MFKFNLKNIFIVAFIFSLLLDIVTTTIVKFKHPIFNESNPLFIFGVSFWFLIGMLIALSAYLVWICIWRYHKMKHMWVRYVIIYFFVLICLLKLGTGVVNIAVINTPSEDIVKLQDDVKLEFYMEQVGDMKAIENLTPPITTKQGYKFRFPFMFTLVIMNFLQYFIWQSFEVHNWKKDG